jgi:DNA replication and repair protein RecF
MNPIVTDRFRQLSGTQQQLELIYTATSQSVGVGGLDGEEIAASFRARLAEVQTRELELGVSLIGPHRDDFQFRLDGVDVGTYGSRGQQRLVVLALKLAEAEYMQAETGERPILLLDDVLSELDPVRRAFVLERFAGEGQTLITTTSLDELPPDFLERAVRYRVSAGSIEREL